MYTIISTSNQLFAVHSPTPNHQFGENNHFYRTKCTFSGGCVEGWLVWWWYLYLLCAENGDVPHRTLNKHSQKTTQFHENTSLLRSKVTEIESQTWTYHCRQSFNRKDDIAPSFLLNRRVAICDRLIRHYYVNTRWCDKICQFHWIAGNHAENSCKSDSNQACLISRSRTSSQACIMSRSHARCVWRIATTAPATDELWAALYMNCAIIKINYFTKGRMMNSGIYHIILTIKNCF